MKFDIVTAPKRNTFHWTPGEITWEEIIEWMQTPADKKEAGGYVLGTLVKTSVPHKKGDKACSGGYHRTKAAIRSRGAITLDVDFPKPGFAIDAQMLLDHAAIIHTTYSSNPSIPRYRIIVPLDRPIAPDEYPVAAGALMQLLGEEQFDPGSSEPERYMFKPSESNPGFFEFHVLDGPPASADKLLADFNQDLSTLPMPKPSRFKRDPLAIDGTVGGFNRAYTDFQELIDVYELPYERSGEDRWKLAGSVAAAGMGVVTPGLVYSHHTNDPAYGETCSAFDLVRLHNFGHLDETAPPKTPINRLPSTLAMLEIATLDVRVIRELIGSDFDAELDAAHDEMTNDDHHWTTRFRLDQRTGTPLDDIHNWDLITNNDPAFKVLYYNELSMNIEINDDLPWRPLGGRPAFDGGDRSGLALYIERRYHIRPGRAYLDDLVNDKALPRRVNPVKDYLVGLKWDGTPRVETCLPGVRPTPYSRLVARKAMVAAVARMMTPGVKWDHMLILFGPEGKGKSYWVELMAKGFSAELGPIRDKDTLIAMQRSWIMMSDESHNMRKADFDAQKEFITRTADVFRMPYDRESLVHKRHCVIWGSTNDERFLRKQEGNRRFLIVRSDDKVDFDLLTDEYIDQVWAEAVYLWSKGELLYLDDSESEAAAEAREEFTEEDPITGLITEFLDTLVPESWDEMSPEARVLWMRNSAEGNTTAEDRPARKIERVCSVQLWVEALGRSRGDHRRQDLLDIGTAMKRIDGWVLLPGQRRHPGYGPQQVFERIKPEDLL